MFKTILSCVMVAFALGATPAHASTISFDVASPVVVGSAFDVDVLVSDVFDGRPVDDVLLGFGFDVTVGDGSVFHYDGADVNTALFGDLALGSPMVAGFALNPFGLGPLDFAEPLRLATLRFTALTAGSTTIGVTWDSTDLNQGLVYFENPGYEPIVGTVTVGAAAPVPEPASLLLFGTGLVGMAARYRARRRDRRTA